MTNSKAMEDMVKGIEYLQWTKLYPDFSFEIEGDQIIIKLQTEQEPQADPEVLIDPEVKFQLNGIKVNGHLHKCFIWYQDYNTDKHDRPFGTITLCASEYNRLPNLPDTIHYNDSDSQSDYVADDMIFILPGSRYYQLALAAYVRKDARDKERIAKQKARRQAKSKK